MDAKEFHAAARRIEGLQRKLCETEVERDAWKRSYSALIDEQRRLLAAKQTEIGALEAERDEMKEEIKQANKEASDATERVVKERDALRAEVAQHRKEHAGDQQAIVGLLSERDKLRAEVTALKHEVDTLSCPYVSGQRVRVKSEGGLITQQSEYGIGKIGIINAFAFVARIGSRGWVDLQDIEPCDPPADHDTPAGKASALVAHPVSRYADTEPELDQPTEVERAETELNRAQWADRYERKESADDVRKVPQ